MPTAVLPPVEAKASFVEGLFNRIAPRYDLLNDCISLGLHRFWKQAAVDALGLQPANQVVDVCTGTGDLVAPLLAAVSVSGNAGGSVVGVDFSDAMLSVARKRYAKEERVRFVQGDALALPLEIASVDAGIVAFGLRNVSSIDAALAELHRVVRVGGRVASLDTVPNPPLLGFTAYFKHLMPLVAAFLSGRRQEYQYLQASTETFDSPEALKARFEAAGFHRVSIQRLGFGTVALVVGEKPFT